MATRLHVILEITNCMIDFSNIHYHVSFIESFTWSTLSFLLTTISWRQDLFPDHKRFYLTVPYPLSSHMRYRTPAMTRGRIVIYAIGAFDQTVCDVNTDITFVFLRLFWIRHVASLFKVISPHVFNTTLQLFIPAMPLHGEEQIKYLYPELFIPDLFLSILIGMISSVHRSNVDLSLRPQYGRKGT